jgi:hypothetical protein
MPTCKQCNNSFSNRISIDGKLYHVAKRVYCVECSPIGSRKFCGNASKKNCLRKGIEHEVVCRSCDKVFKTKHALHECRACQTGKIRHTRKAAAIRELGGCCEICGYDKCMAAMDFHHIDPSLKKFNISAMLDRSVDKLLVEIQKCVLLCNRCHSEVHAGVVGLNQIPRLNQMLQG